jgi:hypothetical protein
MLQAVTVPTPVTPEGAIPVLITSDPEANATAESESVQADPNYKDAVEAATRIRQLAPEYLHHHKLSKRAASDAETIKDELSVQFAIYKAIHVGKGRDGNWGPFITELGFAVRTIDRWVDQKLASGELPEWVVTRLMDNKRQDAATPEAEPEPMEKPYTLLLHFSETQKTTFAKAADKFDEDTLAEVIFEAVTTHPVALAPKKRMTFRDDETEVPTLLGQMERQTMEDSSGVSKEEALANLSTVLDESIAFAQEGGFTMEVPA